MTMESPKLKATRSMLSRELPLGKSADTNVYPGKKSKKANPKIMRRTLEGKSVMTSMSKITRIFRSRSSF